jgi:hypothetical protein
VNVKSICRELNSGSTSLSRAYPFVERRKYLCSGRGEVSSSARRDFEPRRITAHARQRCRNGSSALRLPRPSRGKDRHLVAESAPLPALFRSPGLKACLRVGIQIVHSLHNSLSVGPYSQITLQSDHLFLHFLQYSLDNRTAPRYACSRPELLEYFATTSSAMQLSARRASSLNNRNNRPLPQNLWDVIERFG